MIGKFQTHHDEDGYATMSINLGPLSDGRESHYTSIYKKLESIEQKLDRLDREDTEPIKKHVQWKSRLATATFFIMVGVTIATNWSIIVGWLQYLLRS